MIPATAANAILNVNTALNKVTFMFMSLYS